MCDGCSNDGTDETLVEIGRLGKVWYCPECLPHWKNFEEWEKNERTRHVEEFEAMRRSQLSALRCLLTVLPDE